MNLRQAPNQSKRRRLKCRIKKKYESMKNRVRCDGQNGKRPLIPYDPLVTVTRFFGPKQFILFGQKANLLREAFRHNPAITIGKRRNVKDMHIYYNKTKGWMVMAKPSRPLPLIKPPPSILGFRDISIGLSADSDIEELNCFIENALSIPGRYRFVVMISRKGKHVPNDQILSMITSSVESLRSGIASFPIALIYLSELGSVANFEHYYRRMLEANVVQSARWLSIYVKAPHPTAIDCHKQWLYHQPNASNVVTSNGAGGIALRVLHLRCFKLMNDSENIFWLLSASISSDFINAVDGQQCEFAVLYENMRLTQSGDPHGEWSRKEFTLENENTGEVLEFKRVRIKLRHKVFHHVFVLHRRPKIGPLQSIDHSYRAFPRLAKSIFKFFNKTA